MYDTFAIQSHIGLYQVFFRDNISIDFLTDEWLEKSHFIIDSQVAKIYQKKLAKIISAHSVLYIDATEKNKSLEEFPRYVSHLVSKKIRRGHQLIAIGGGIIQDITCFLAATLLRGIDWHFFPTTLLAQADSCIGSKSSINCNNIKNILGTYTPPKNIYIFSEFLKTLGRHEIQSGVGEMIKVHAIDGIKSIDAITKDYDDIFKNETILQHYLKRSLAIKKNIIEQDEFDQGIRNIMNYGHTFGHAIESATRYAIPHGIAVTIGMDMANYLSARYHNNQHFFFEKMHSLLQKNYAHFSNHTIPFDDFMTAIVKDKKNTGKNSITVIIPDNSGKIIKTTLENNLVFQNHCKKYLAIGRN